MRVQKGLKINACFYVKPHVKLHSNNIILVASRFRDCNLVKCLPDFKHCYFISAIFLFDFLCMTI